MATKRCLMEMMSRHDGISRRIAIAMSGGVDSSVAAYLLVQEHLQKQQKSANSHLLGIHMSNWNHQDDDHDGSSSSMSSSSSSSCWEQDWKDAQSVAQLLDLPIVHASFQADYWNFVFEPYCQQLSQQSNSIVTPNPDVDCNRYIKFGVLKDYLKSRYNIDTLATGHYARLWDPNTILTSSRTANQRQHFPEYLQQALEEHSYMADEIIRLLLQPQKDKTHPKPILMAARDLTKDQSYFLSNVPGDAFSNVLFPLGDLYKHPQTKNNNGVNDTSTLSVREIAQQAQLPTAKKRESMGICFVGKRKHGNFIHQYVSMQNDGDDENTTIISNNNNNNNNNNIPNRHDEKSSTRRVIRCINVDDGCVVHAIDLYNNNSNNDKDINNNKNNNKKHNGNDIGLLYATIGQGAKISGAKEKWFVVDKPNPKTILVCPGTHHPSLYSDKLYIRTHSMHWIAGQAPINLSKLQCFCRIRHLQPLVPCQILVRPNNNNSINDTNFNTKDWWYEVELEQPLRGIAPGQICAIYTLGGLICLGGGPIAMRGPNYMELHKDLPFSLHPSGSNDLSVL